ncbi:hypothetical protein NDU88_006644 [Pleurodeles waltl]|uniref:Uncharacterized protein n=1 Tax=Pleurodeles waltl TaxID=8319 RepID=A0AAV7MDF6_PLEWA|nr:hypothetical protein NDU88_006644 [Pleurodeles waltl]
MSIDQMRGLQEGAEPMKQAPGLQAAFLIKRPAGGGEVGRRLPGDYPDDAADLGNITLAAPSWAYSTVDDWEERVRKDSKVRGHGWRANDRPTEVYEETVAGGRICEMKNCSERHICLVDL